MKKNEAEHYFPIYLVAARQKHAACAMKPSDFGVKNVAPDKKNCMHTILNGFFCIMYFYFISAKMQPEMGKKTKVQHASC